MVHHAAAGRPGKDDALPDLHTQLEEFFHQVWVSEAEWRFDDRLDLATRNSIIRKQPESPRG
jgi:hypothetical protein